MRSLAIIGTGIAGMACAYFLRDRYKVTVYEKNKYIGGHTNTVYVDEGGASVPIDTGFMVYNDRTYPNLIRFFKHLEVESQDTSMSFSVNDTASDTEISFTDLSTFFPHWKTLCEPSRYRLLVGLKQLFKQAKEYIADPDPAKLSLREFVERYRIHPLTTERFLLPMTAAIWSTPTDRMLDYPAATLFRFLSNHGMLGFSDPFQWKTLVGGSQQYKAKVLARIGDSVTTANPATRVEKENDKVRVDDGTGGSRLFDHVILATHADQALATLSRPSPLQSKLLSAFAYNKNPVVLHSDQSVMPRYKKAWASWNYRYEKPDTNGNRQGSVHYWMNRLQNVSEKQNYFVSVDYSGEIPEELTHWKFEYEHPRFDEAAIAAQSELPTLNEEGSILFCGSYFRYGFHEDAFSSALEVVKRLSDGKDPLA